MFTFVKMMIKSHIKRSMAIIFGIGCSVAMMFCLIQMGDSIVEQYRKLISKESYWDIRVSGLTKEEADTFRELMVNENIEEIGTGYSLRKYASIKGLNIMQMVIYGVDEDMLNCTGQLKIVDGDIPNNKNEVCIEEYVSQKLDVSVGDTISIYLDNNSKEHNVIVCGILENTDMLSSSDWTYGSLVVSLDFINNKTEFIETDNLYVENISIDKDGLPSNLIEIRNKCTDTYGKLYDIDYNSILQRKLNKEAVSEYENKIYEYITKNVVFNEDKVNAYTEFDRNSTVGHALQIIVCLIAISIVLLIFNNMHLSITENTKELGVLRCIGMNCYQTGIVILVENILYCFSGYIIGVAVGNVINNIVARRIMLWTVGTDIILEQLMR